MSEKLIQTDTQPGRVLLLANLEQDVQVLQAQLAQAGIRPDVCRDIQCLCREITAGAGTAIIAEAALVENAVSVLEECLTRQPDWSDLPLIVVTGREAPSADCAQIERSEDLSSALSGQGFFARATLLERPVHAVTLISAVQVALQSRLRQYQLRDYLEERDHREDNLRDSEQRFRQIFDNAAVGIARVGLDGRYLQVNDRLCEITGYSRSELLERTFEDITHPDDRGLSWRVAQRLHSGQASHVEFEKRYHTKNGSVVWLHLSTSLVRDAEGEPVYFVSVFQDVSDRKAAEQALRELNANLERRVVDRTAILERQAFQLRRLAAQLSDAEQRERTRLATTLHDGLQQLIVAAQMRLQSCRQVVPESAQPALARVRELLNESIAVSRSLVSELSPPVLQNAGLILVLEWLAEWFRDKHGLTVRLESRPGLPRVPEKTKTVLFQIVRELLFNVVKHSGAREARVQVAEIDKHIEVTVEDRGSGFDPEQVHEADDPMGFGLLNIRERIEALGGTMRIESSRGAGTRVIVNTPRLALEAVAEPPILPATRLGGGPTSPATATGAPVRILVADDHSIVREGLVTLLSQHPDFEVVGEAADGEQAIAAAAALTPDVVLMDVTMPRVNGFEATRRIKQDCPETQIIALSMHEEQAVVTAMMDAGASAYLRKDGPSDLLFKTIQDAVSIFTPQ
jgi:PAS domain S-box-containing protein